MSRKSKKPSARPKRDVDKVSPSKTPRLPGGARGAVFGICALLLLMVLLVFGRSAWFEFVDFDDIGNVSENPFVNKGLTPGGVIWAFSHTQVGDWIPLTTVSHMLACDFFELWAGGHHLINVLLHAATSILLFLVLRALTGSLWRCAFVAALFALHPLRAESVAWISERKDVLSALFFMLTLGAYARWTRRPGGKSGKSFAWVAVFLALGLLCKTMLVTTPLVLLLLDLWPLRRAEQTRFSRLVIEKIPLILLSIAAAVGQLLAAREGIVSVDSYPIARRAANAVVSCAEYVVQMFWPANLAAFYPYPRNGVDSWALIGSLVLLFVVSAAAFRWRRQAPWFAVGWLWYLGMLAPVLGLVQAGQVARADRYTYLPQIGLYLIVAWAAATWCAGHQKRRLVAGTLAVVALVAASLMTFRQTGFWEDSDTLWNRALACTSNNDTAHFNLGTASLQKGKIDEAMAHYEKTLEANPAYVDAHINLGQILLQKGRRDEAIVHYRKAVEIKPGYANSHYDLGVVLVQDGQFDEAIAHYRKALEINPAYSDARNGLGSALLQSGKFDEAITSFEELVRAGPGDAKARNNLAAALAQKGRIPEAVVQYEKVLELDPNHAKARNSLAWLHATSADAAVRNGARALQLAERASQLTGGNNPLILRTLAAACAEVGRFEDALLYSSRAQDLAAAQKNDELAHRLRDDIELYKAGKPLR